VALGSTAACLVLLPPVESRAQAQRGGSVRLVRQSIRESHGAWRVLMLLRLPKPPQTPEVVLHFHLTQVIDFLPSSDPDKPRHVPVDPPRLIEREKTVDMRDVQGRVSRATRTELSLSRADGFRAGVWTLRVDGPDGPLDLPVRITLQGVNEEPTPPDERPDAGP
jgi:hypothetical protein